MTPGSRAVHEARRRSSGHPWQLGEAADRAPGVASDDRSPDLREADRVERRAGIRYGSFRPRRPFQPRFPAYPFSLGLASGYPTPDGVLLWTRLAPDPLNGGGLPDRELPVWWQVAGDENFRQIVRQGTELARPELAHSVHVEVEGLEPAREYFYRFIAGSDKPHGKDQDGPGGRRFRLRDDLHVRLLPAVRAWLLHGLPQDERGGSGSRGAPRRLHLRVRPRRGRRFRRQRSELRPWYVYRRRWHATPEPSSLGYLASEPLHRITESVSSTH